MTDDDDLFAIRPKPKLRPRPKPKTTADSRATGFVGPRWPVAALACRCGARDEVREPIPEALDCWGCKGLETMRRTIPRHLPPVDAGRPLSALEREGLRLDAKAA